MCNKELANNENTSQDVLQTLESYISTYSNKFSEIGRKIVYAIFASACKGDKTKRIKVE